MGNNLVYNLMDFYNQKWVMWFAPKEYTYFAITIGQFCFYSTPVEKVDAGWRRHEDCHKRQFKRCWYIGYPFVFIYDYLVGRCNGLSSFKAYQNTRFEIEARNCE